MRYIPAFTRPVTLGQVFETLQSPYWLADGTEVDARTLHIRPDGSADGVVRLPSGEERRVTDADLYLREG